MGNGQTDRDRQTDRQPASHIYMCIYMYVYICIYTLYTYIVYIIYIVYTKNDQKLKRLLPRIQSKPNS